MALMPSRDDETSPKPKKETARHRLRRFRIRDVFDLAYSSVWPWVVLFVFCLTALLTPGLSFRVQEFELGDISSVTVRAPFDFSYEDEVTTEARREEAADAVAEIFIFNDAAMVDARNRIASAFELGRESLGISLSDGAEAGVAEAEQNTPLELVKDELLAALQDRLEVTLRDEELDLLLVQEFSTDVEQVLTGAVTSVLSRDIVASKERLLASGRAISRREAVSKSRQVRRDFSNILSIEEAQELLVVQMASISDFRQAERRKLASIGARFVEPTLTFNFGETERERVEARTNVDAVYYQVQRGKTIVRAGDEIDENGLRQLQILASTQSQRWGWAGAVGALFLAGLLLLIQWYLLRPSRTSDTWRHQAFAMVGIVIVSPRRGVSAGGSVGPFKNSVR